ncbi:enoyl-CoA hydratase-related protein [Neolewinella agarilytica]|uniref:Enoyl-CoA hydratase n=1 Tax=Neolewinella agarilytica TaxID=478744 RepID=A0A1H8ZL91_9BACT|nr:enoyl-CoA hydratase-related protein [Neolewinella agarilytica]SEP65289.1 enoyl-CoA hydratase [Neolewinella agarilytica]
MKTSISNHIATVTFSHPDRANALGEADWDAMGDTFRELDENDDVHVVILAGEGKHFCAGMDLAVLGSLQARAIGTKAEMIAQLETFILRIQASITAIEQCRKPVLAAIHGGCIGGGVDIISACDIRYCSEDAYFTVKEVDFGIVADIGTLQRLPYILQPGLVSELAFTGRKMFAPEALRSGLVNQSFSNRETLLAGVTEIAASIASKPPRVIAGIKHNLLYQREHSTADSLKYVADYSANLLLG